MNGLVIFIWVFIGAALAFLFLSTQRWSVMAINPEQPNFSQLLIIGGAVIRWAIIFLIFMYALSYSIFAMLIVFSTFMITRLLLLFRWQRFLFSREDRTH